MRVNSGLVGKGGQTQSEAMTPCNDRVTRMLDHADRRWVQLITRLDGAMLAIHDKCVPNPTVSPNDNCRLGGVTLPVMVDDVALARSVLQLLNG